LRGKAVYACLALAFRQLELDVSMTPASPKVVILAGGRGTRLAEETDTKPKPMVEVGGRPLLWHIMNIYSHCGFREFIICVGYKGYLIKEYFANYLMHVSDVTFRLGSNETVIHRSRAEPWTVTVLDTGLETMTGGRLRRIRSYLGEDEFLLTYGDGVSDVNVGAVLDAHRRHKRMATITAVRPPGRFGALQIDNERVTAFVEKPPGDGGWINGGFMVMNPSVVDWIEDDATALEVGTLAKLSERGELSVHCHHGFWHAVDTIRDVRALEEMWASGRAPWKIW
jgi:glucose-1-phosphate cytidylyltransferase